MRVSSITKNAGKACNNRLYRHIRTFEKIVKNYFVIYSHKRNKKRKIILLFYLCLYIHMNFWLGILEIWEIILSLPAKKHCRLLHPVVLHHTYQSNGISSASISNVCCSRSLAVAASLAAMSAFCAAAFAASAAAFAATAASSAFFESSFFSSFSSS